MKTNFKTDVVDIYWNHNTAYHKWILSKVKGKDKVLDVGCGEGLLVYRLSKECKQVIGIDVHGPSIEKARKRIKNIKNSCVEEIGFEDFGVEPNSFDAVIFVATIHHMDLNFCVNKSIKLLKPGGQLLIVGLAHPYTLIDKIIEILRVLPVKISDLFHDVKGDVGAPIADYRETLKEIRELSKNILPNVKIKQGLYFRYLLSWKKPTV